MAIPMMNEGKEVKAVGYVRVSTEDQAREGYSLEAQESRIRDYVRSRGWELVGIYKDEDKSAYSGIVRPGYNAMISDMDKWNALVCLKMDRVWRNQRKFLEMMDILDAAKKDFVSIDESWDTTQPMGKFVRDLFARLAQLESEQTSYRVKVAFDEKFKSDPTAWFTRAPLGYTLTRREEGGKKGGRLVVDETEAKIVRRIFDLVIEGVPLQRMPAIFHKEGIRGKDGGKLEMTSLVQIVHNPVYGGYVYRNGVLRRNGHEAVIPIETFNQAQVALYTRTTRHRRYPLILGAERIECTMKATSGGGSCRVYIPKVRPPELDEMVMAETLRKARRRA